MTTIVFFKGWRDPWHPTDSSGFNGTGYVTDAGVIIYPRRSRIARTTIEAVRRRHHRLIDLSKHPRAAQIETFFTNNVINNTLYVAAMQEVGNLDSLFWDNPIKILLLRLLGRSWATGIVTAKRFCLRFGWCWEFGHLVRTDTLRPIWSLQECAMIWSR